MDLKTIDFSKLNDLEQYYNVFGNYTFYNEHDLKITDETVLPFISAPACNRSDILNYINFISILFDNFDYTQIECGAQLNIFDVMKKGIMNMYNNYKIMLNDYKPSDNKNWAQRFDEESDISELRSKLSCLDLIITAIDTATKKIRDKMDKEKQR